MKRPALTAIVLALAGCKSEEQASYIQFNATDDQVKVEVGVADLLDPAQTDLHSTTGEVVVGNAMVDPGGGPAGTSTSVVVVVDDAYEALIDRTSVRIDSGDRGVDEYDLTQDSADRGYWKITLVSVADEGERRTDIFTFRLWQLNDTGTTSAASSDSGSSSDTASSDTATSSAGLVDGRLGLSRSAISVGPLRAGESGWHAP